MKEGKREGLLSKKLLQRLLPWVDTTLEWVDARTKESWQWDNLLAKKLCNDDVLTRCVTWLGSHHRRKPVSCIAHRHEAALAHASSHQRGSPNMRCDKMVCRRWPRYTIIWARAQTLLMLTTLPIRVAGSCRVVSAACPGLLVVTFLSYSKIP